MKRSFFAIAALLLSTLLSAQTPTITLDGEAITVKGNFPTVGKKAPKARVVLPDFTTKQIGGKNSRIQVIATVPSIETPVCSAESKRFDDTIKQYADEVDMTIVSMDLPYADDRFCKGQGIENVTIASDFAHREVGENYGAAITSGEYTGLLIRAIFVVDKNGRIVYQEIVPEVTHEPQYDKVMEAIQTAIK